jgi:hypothetical protein
MNRTDDGPAPRAVRISSTARQLEGIALLVASVSEAVGDVPALLDLAQETGLTAPKPGEGNTALCGKCWHP